MSDTPHHASPLVAPATSTASVRDAARAARPTSGSATAQRLQLAPQLLEHLLARARETPRRAEAHRAEERHREVLPLGERPAHVLEPGRQHDEAGMSLGEMRDPRLELADPAPRAARALGEQQQAL